MIKKYIFTLAMMLIFGLVHSADAIRATDRGPVRYKGESSHTDVGSIRSLFVHDVGNVRMTLSNWGEQGNPDGSPGYFGFEFPLGSESDFLFSSGIWVGAISNGVKLVSTGTDGDNGTNEFAPSFDRYVATSKQYSNLAGRSYVMGAKEVDDDGDWTLADDLNRDGKPSTNWDGGRGTIGADDDGDGEIDEELADGIDNDGDGLIDEDTDASGDFNGDGNCNYDPEPHIDEDPAGDMSADFIDNDFDGLVDGDDPDFDGDVVPGSLDDDGDGLFDEDGVARGTQEYFCVYDDTDVSQVSSPDSDGHTPLNIMVSQRTYAWGEEYAGSFIIVDLIVRNIGTLPLTEVYMGLFADADIGARGEGGDAASLDDWNFYDEENLMMIHGDDINDADGWGPGLFAMKIVRTPAPLDELNISFQNFDRESGGDPDSNADKYDMISARASNNSDSTTTLADWRFLMGFGPLAGGWFVEPGGELPVTVAFIAGSSLDYIRKNAQWAQRIYDNDFQGPAAPDQPDFGVDAFVDHAHIWWRDNAEGSVDPITQVSDFEGYVVQRSTSTNTWFTLAQYDSINTLEYDEFERENLNLGMPYDHNPEPGINWEWEIEFEIVDSDTVQIDTLGRMYWYDDYEVLRRQTYFYIVRSFDQGVPGAGVLITPIGKSYAEVTIGFNEITQSNDSDLDQVYVYPNPYKGSHAEEYKGKQIDGTKQYPRKLYFANLPATGSEISIYSLSGDHIVSINHDNNKESYEWNMENSFQQEIVSGVYLYVVEAGGEMAINKFVVLK